MNKLKLLLEELNIDNANVQSRNNSNDIKIIKKYFSHGKNYEEKGLNAIISKHYNIDVNLSSASISSNKSIRCLTSFLFNGVLKEINNVEEKKLELIKLKNYYFFNSRTHPLMTKKNKGIILPFAVLFFELKGKKGILDLDCSGKIPIEIYEFPQFNAISAGKDGNHRLKGISLGYELFKNCTLETRNITRYKLTNNDNNFTKKVVSLLKIWDLKIDLCFNIIGNKYEFSRYNQKIVIECKSHPLANSSIFKILENLTSWFTFMNSYNIEYISVSQYNQNEFNLRIKNESLKICKKSLIKFANLPFFVAKMNKYYRTLNVINLFKIMIKRKKYLRGNKNKPRYILKYLNSYLIRDFSVFFWKNILNNLKMK